MEGHFGWHCKESFILKKIDQMQNPHNPPLRQKFYGIVFQTSRLTNIIGKILVLQRICVYRHIQCPWIPIFTNGKSTDREEQYDPIDRQ